jgi:hypothetical protein
MSKSGLSPGGPALERDDSPAPDAMRTVDAAASVGPVFGLIPVPLLDRPFRRPLFVRLALLSPLRLRLLPFKELPLVLPIVGSISLSRIGQHWGAMTTSRGDADGGWRGLSWAGLRTDPLSSARSTVSTAVMRSQQRSTSDTRPSRVRRALGLDEDHSTAFRGDTRPAHNRLPVLDGSASVGPCLRLILLSAFDRPGPPRYPSVSTSY